jgi:signal transduction histidine kinase
MNGLETAAIIRERERSRHIPIIFLTGLDETEEMLFKGYSAGAVDYLVKPIKTHVLRAKVEVFVELAMVRAKLQAQIAERTRFAAEISKLNRALAQKNEVLHDRSTQLQESVHELESYSYSISHDMRAPLRAMQGYSDILLQECSGQLSPEHQGYLHKISSGAKRLDRLIADVLSYSLLSRSKFKLEPVDLDQLTREIIDQYPGMQPPAAEITLEGKLPRVWANEATLTQCISNLLGNAIKFVAKETTPRVRIDAQRKNPGEVVVSFHDNGIGISPADLDRIFGIFVRVNPAFSYEGTGIGLSIVRKAAEKMGGKVGVESIPAGGSRFWLQLRTVEEEDLP